MTFPTACGPAWESTTLPKQPPPAFYSDAAGKVAVLAKTARNAMIGFVVLAIRDLLGGARSGQNRHDKAAFLWKKFPKFILGFLSISLLVGFHRSTRDKSRPRQSIEVGIPFHLRRRWPAHELS